MLHYTNNENSTSGARLVCAVVLAICCTGYATSQVSKIDDPDQLAPHAVRLGFGDMNVPKIALAGAPAGAVFKRWGVTFPGSGPFEPVIRKRDRSSGVAGIPEYFWYVSTESEGDGQPTQPLIVDFALPLKSVLLWPARYVGLSSGQEQLRLQAFDAEGTSLGTIEQTGIDGPVGLTTSSPKGISKVLFSNPSGVPESIEEIAIEYLEGPRAFTSFLAQIGDGKVQLQEGDDEVTLTTSFIISNPTELPVQCRIAFFDSAGQPLDLTVNGTTASTVDFQLDPHGSMTLVSDGSSNPASSGYAVVSAAAPVASLAVFSMNDASGTELSNADVESSTGVVSALVPVYIFREEQFDSGFAIVNTGGVEAEVVIEADQQEAMLMTLGPGEHVARFVSELFPSTAERDVQSSLYVMSSQPVAVISLRTERGLPVSAVPIASLQE